MENAFSINVLLFCGSPKGTVAFHFDKSARIARQKKPRLFPCLVHVPIYMHKISILIRRVVAVHINTQFTNTSACFHSQTMGFFSTHQMA